MCGCACQIRHILKICVTVVFFIYHCLQLYSCQCAVVLVTYVTFSCHSGFPHCSELYSFQCVVVLVAYVTLQKYLSQWFSSFITVLQLYSQLPPAAVTLVTQVMPQEGIINNVYFEWSYKCSRHTGDAILRVFDNFSFEWSHKSCHTSDAIREDIGTKKNV